MIVSAGLPIVLPVDLINFVQLGTRSFLFSQNCTKYCC